MIVIDTLDTVAPPTWDGTPISLTPVIDVGTALRHFTGDDKLNYWNNQRVEGDLFNRDLANFKTLKSLIDHLSTRGGLTFSSPQISLLDNTHISLGRFGGLVAEVPEYFVVGLGCYIQTGGVNANVGTRIIKVSDDSVLATSAAKDEIEWSVPGLAPTDTRGVELDGTDPMEAQLYNESGGVIVAQGFAIVCPRNQTA